MSEFDWQETSDLSLVCDPYMDLSGKGIQIEPSGNLIRWRRVYDDAVLWRHQFLNMEWEHHRTTLHLAWMANIPMSHAALSCGRVFQMRNDIPHDCPHPKWCEPSMHLRSSSFEVVNNYHARRLGALKSMGFIVSSDQSEPFARH